MLLGDTEIIALARLLLRETAPPTISAKGATLAYSLRRSGFVIYPVTLSLTPTSIPSTQLTRPGVVT